MQIHGVLRSSTTATETFNLPVDVYLGFTEAFKADMVFFSSSVPWTETVSNRERAIFDGSTNPASSLLIAHRKCGGDRLDRDMSILLFHMSSSSSAAGKTSLNLNEQALVYK